MANKLDVDFRKKILDRFYDSLHELSDIFSHDDEVSLDDELDCILSYLIYRKFSEYVSDCSFTKAVVFKAFVLMQNRFIANDFAQYVYIPDDSSAGYPF